MEDTFSSLQMRSWHPGTLTHTVRVPSSHHLLPPSSTSTSSTSSRDKTNHKHLPCGYFSLLTTFLWEDAEESLCCCLSSPFNHSCFSLTSSQFNIELSQAKDIRWRPLESAASCLGKYGDGWGSLGRKLSILTCLLSTPPPPLPPCPSFVFLFKRSSIFQLLLWRVEGSQAEEEILFPIFVLRGETGRIGRGHVVVDTGAQAALLTSGHNGGIRGQIGLTQRDRTVI